MPRVLSFLLFVIYSWMAYAVPALRERCSLRLADGTVVEATWMGDETTHFYQTDDGRCLKCDDNGIAYFVDAEKLHQAWKARALKRQTGHARRYALRQRKGSGAITGSKHGLVILVQFPKVPFHFTKQDFDDLFNKENYTDDINIGSVHDYFRDASYGKFDFSFDVIGPITMSNPLSYYGDNNDNDDDVHPAVMVREAVQMIDEEVDFSQYDWNGDGEVEQIFIIHSGYDEAQSHTNADIWSHAWTLAEALEEGDGEGTLVVDGVTVNSYATSAELRGKTGTFITGIGTACHEFAHCFGLPDFYDTDGKNFGMSTWSIMDYGEYNGNGGCPAGFTSYERMFCGWLEPTELIEPVYINDMPDLTSEPVCYLLRNSGKADEYYLLENRQKKSWDRYLDGHGMLILHVDYDETAWAFNMVNTIRSHQRMTIIPADNILYAATLAGDPWPGTSKKTELHESSVPAATLYNLNAEGDKLMHHSISQISESDDGLISFIFDEDATGISFTTARSPMGEGRIYNTAGQVVNDIWSNVKPIGLYIHNGKKILIR